MLGRWQQALLNVQQTSMLKFSMLTQTSIAFFMRWLVYVFSYIYCWSWCDAVFTLFCQSRLHRLIQTCISRSLHQTSHLITMAFVKVKHSYINIFSKLVLPGGGIVLFCCSLKWDVMCVGLYELQLPGLQSVRSEQIDSNTLDMVRAGDQLSFRMSRHITPWLLMLQW